MKKAFVLFAVAVFALSSPFAFAADKKAKESRQEKEDARRAELTDMEWDVTVAGKGGGADKLVFKGSQVSLKGFEKLGYGPTAYSLIAYEDSDRGTWETYQIHKDGKSSLSIRGDWTDKIMNGVISQQTIEGKTLGSWSFSSQSKTPLKAEEASSESKGSAAPAADQAPAKSSMAPLVSKESVKS
ncbi:MAG TPA: hypothetical protein VL404_05940 [Candidatus Eisenbacteria bacterium]|jgi:hypothetical protein|nr:hypothetical protein [Candidatus Eisenbacteria bacterium]